MAFIWVPNRRSKNGLHYKKFGPFVEGFMEGKPYPLIEAIYVLSLKRREKYDEFVENLEPRLVPQ